MSDSSRRGLALLVAILGGSMAFWIWPGVMFRLGLIMSRGRLYHSYYYIPPHIELQGRWMSVGVLVLTVGFVALILKLARS